MSDELFEREPWRRLGYVSETAKALNEQQFAPLFGTKAQRFRQSLEQLQESRIKNLKRDFDYMEAWEQAPDSYVVVNFRTLGRYNVDMNEYTCDCYDSFYTFTDEGSGVLCKHLLFVGLIKQGLCEEG